MIPALVIFPGCLGYLVHAGKGQLDIISDNVPINRAIKSPQQYGLNTEDVDKLREVLRVQKFSVNTLKLSGDGNYKKIKILDRKYAAYQVTAAERLALRSYEWYFPIVGNLAYIAFFEKEKQTQLASELTDQGYDVRLQNVIAYSTLGWFNDPMLSSMLLLSKADLINTIIHEMGHATIFFKGDTDFNESVATFLGDEGSKLYLKQYYPEDLRAIKLAEDQRYDQNLFADHIDALYLKLQQLYQSKLPDKQKILQKEKLIRQSQNEWKGMSTQLKTHRYSFYANLDFQPNNAHILSYKRYFLDMSLFYRGYRLFDNDYSRYLEFLKTLPKSDSKSYKQILQDKLDEIGKNS